MSRQFTKTRRKELFQALISSFTFIVFLICLLYFYNKTDFNLSESLKAGSVLFIAITIILVIGFAFSKDTYKSPSRGYFLFWMLINLGILGIFLKGIIDSQNQYHFSWAQPIILLPLLISTFYNLKHFLTYKKGHTNG